MVQINKVFKALADNTRREILKILSKKDMAAGEIAKYFDISKPSISKHLEILRDAELITSQRKGQFIIYSINTTVLQDALSGFLNLINTKDEEKENDIIKGDDSDEKN